MSKKSLRIGLSGAAGALIVLAILVAVNVILGAARVRKDLTAERIYTLSPGTRAFLGGLERGVTLKLFFSRGNENLPVGFKQYARRVTDLLREYEAHGGGRVALETYDPQPDSDEEEWAQRYGLAGQNLDRYGMEPDFYFGLVAVSGTREAALPFLSPGAEPQLEYLVTRLIHEVTRAGKPKIGVLSALRVMGPPQRPLGMTQDEAGGWQIMTELARQCELVPLTDELETVPADIETVLAIHPKGLPDKTLFALDQFVLRGGRLLAFVDPLCVADRESGLAADPYGTGPASSDLNRLTKAWGYELVPGQVVADVEAASYVTFGGRGSERLPTWLSLRPDNINRDEIATAALENLMMPFAGAFKGAAAEGLTAVTLAQTYDEAALLPAFQAAQAGVEKMRAAKPEGSLVLALRLQGRFKTAFPDGAPAAFLKEGEKDSVVILVADADMLHDRNSLQEMNFLGQRLLQPVNDNLSFGLNMVEQLTGDEALIGLRSRGTYGRPFDRVVELEKQAQQRWQEEELKLVEKLREAQARLNELQRSKDEDQQYILTPEQKREIENFRQERFETQRQLKEVRKSLRRDIERLGLKVKILNMAAMPAAVALFGLLHGWRRKKKASS
ncbi:MAG TPA: Gldg family protein [Kiritimatiellia bacterium]|nr:Gldg family protein [Kiritimatiellia bacterium]HRZ12461.1 Gldg family protein [Kiritimatiellia bacterium]HSA17781.1 Gldg family protein [Kiritimatiellia bacterium]